MDGRSLNHEEEDDHDDHDTDDDGRDLTWNEMLITLLPYAVGVCACPCISNPYQDRWTRRNGMVWNRIG